MSAIEINPDKIYGLPEYMLQKGQMKIEGKTGGQFENKGVLDSNKHNQMIKQSSIELEHRGPEKDCWQQMYHFITSKAKNSGFLDMISTKAWNEREINSSKHKTKIKLYLDNVTTEIGTNFELSVSNTLESVKRTTLMEQLDRALAGNEVGNFLSGLETVFGAAAAIDQKINSGSGDDGIISKHYADYLAIKNMFKMISREGVKIWTNGELIINNKFIFTFRAHSKDTVKNEVFDPVKLLLTWQTPNTIFLGSGDNQAEEETEENVQRLQFNVQEKVPPLDISLKYLNGMLKYDHCIIKNMELDYWDLKPVNVAGDIKPTQVRVTMTIESILPLQKYIDYVINSFDSDSVIQYDEQQKTFKQQSNASKVAMLGRR